MTNGFCRSRQPVRQILSGMITIQKQVYDSMIAHAKHDYPNEACGVLGAKELGNGAHFFAMKNVDYSPVSYFMDPKEQLKIFKEMRELGIQMTGIFHSHVASVAYPSAKDVRLAFYPEVSYLIVSLSQMDKPVLRSFKIENDLVKEEEIKIVS